MNPSIRSNSLLAIVLCALGTTMSLAANAQGNPQVAEAMACTEESQRLERLACFDEVFGTPFSGLKTPSLETSPSAGARPLLRNSAAARVTARCIAILRSWQDIC